MAGVLGTSAPVIADGVLLAEFGLGAMLLVGMFLARSGRVRVHAIVQSTTVLVNLPVVLLWMVPAYLSSVVPGLPGELLEPYYLVPTVMLLVGGFAQGLGLFVLLVAGTNVVPERWRFRRYKVWMRTVLALWWAVLILGFGTYYTWFVLGYQS